MDHFTGIEYLKIDIANNFGLDKEDWHVRLDWFNQNEDKLDILLKQAEEPALFYAGIQAYEAYKAGKSSGYPISLDATSSGIQILACLTGDRKAASLCNVIDTGHREDAYTILYNRMTAKIGESAKIERKLVKQSIMTSFYGSTAMPKKVFGEGALLATFTETMEEGAPGAWELNETMLAIWDDTVDCHRWVMPDNFHVQIKVMDTITETVHWLNEPHEVSFTVNQPIQRGRSLGANMTHSIDGMIVREMVHRCSYNLDHVNDLVSIINRGKSMVRDDRDQDAMVKTLWSHYEESGFLSARILDYLDVQNMGLVERSVIQNLIESLPEKPFKVISVHDCFRCLPNYGNDLRQQYNNLLSEIARSEMLSFLLSQIMNRPVRISKLDPDLWKDVVHANYALS